MEKRYRRPYNSSEQQDPTWSTGEDSHLELVKQDRYNLCLPNEIRTSSPAKSATEQLREYLSTFGYTSGVKTDFDTLNTQNDSLQSRIQKSVLPYAPWSNPNRVVDNIYQNRRDYSKPNPHTDMSQENFPNRSPEMSPQEIEPTHIATNPYTEDYPREKELELHLWKSCDLPLTTPFAPILASPLLDSTPAESNLQSSMTYSSSSSSEEPLPKLTKLPFSSTEKSNDTTSRVSSPSSAEIRDFEDFLQTRLKEKKPKKSQPRLVKPEKQYRCPVATFAYRERPPTSPPQQNGLPRLDPMTLELCRPLLQGTATSHILPISSQHVLSPAEKVEIRAKLNSIACLADWQHVLPPSRYHEMLGPPLVSPARIDSLISTLRAQSDHDRSGSGPIVKPSSSLSSLHTLNSTSPTSSSYSYSRQEFPSTEKLNRLLENTKHLVRFGRSSH